MAGKGSVTLEPPIPEVIEFLEENWHESRINTYREYYHRGYGGRDKFYSDLNWMVQQFFPVKCDEMRDDLRTDFLQRYAGIYNKLIEKGREKDAADVLDKMVKLTGVSEPERILQQIQTGDIEVKFDFGVETAEEDEC